MKLRTLTLLLIIIYQFSAVLTLHLRTQSQNLRKQNGFLKTHIKNIKDDDDFKTFVEKLNDTLHDGNFVEELGKELKKSSPHFKCSPKNLKVKGLIPTQSQIGLHDSLEYVFSPEVGYTDYFSPSAINIVGPIITLNEKYIIDGHHRWSQLYLVNKDAEITAINCDDTTTNAIEALKKFQVAIGALIKTIPSNKAGANDIYKYSTEDYTFKKESQIVKFLEEIVPPVELPEITEPMYEKLLKEVREAEKNKEKKGVMLDKPHKIAYFFFGLNKKKTDLEGTTPRDKIIRYLFNSIKEFKNEKQPIPNAPERLSMPQVDKANEPQEKSTLYEEIVKEPLIGKEPTSPVIKLLNRHDISVK